MKPINLAAMFIGLILVAALPLSAWNLLAPAAWSWIPADRAAAIGLMAVILLLLAARTEATAQKPAETPEDSDTTNGTPND